MSTIIYTTLSCPYSKQVRDWLNDHKINYTEIKVDGNSVNANEMVEKSGQMGVPVMEHNGKIIVGWNKQALEELFLNDKQ